MKIFTLVVIAILIGLGLGYATTVAEFGLNPVEPALEGYQGYQGSQASQDSQGSQNSAVGQQIASSSNPQGELSPVAEGDPRLVVNETNFNFGQVSQRQKKTHSFVIYNSGGDDLILGEAKKSCGCTNSKISRKVIPSGESATVDFIWETRGNRGNVTKKITIPTNDPSKSSLRLGVTGFVTPFFQFKPRNGINANVLSRTAEKDFSTKLYFYKKSNVKITGHQMSDQATSKFFVLEY
ncbi:MAG: DUF1573 domain-containing protein, partial [Planctomycetales bacterium]